MPSSLDSFYRRTVADLSVIVLNWTDPRDLERTIQGLGKSHLAPREILVVSIGSLPPPDLDACPLPVRVLRIPGEPNRPPLAAARNLAAREARGKHLVFTHASGIPSRQFVETYAAALDAEDALWTGTTCQLHAPLLEPDWTDGALEARTHGPATPGSGEILSEVSPQAVRSRNFAIRRDTYQRIGGFDERFVGPGGESEDFALTAQQQDLRIHQVGATLYRPFHALSSPPLAYLDAILENSRYFRHKWGRWPSIAWLQSFAEIGLIDLDLETDRLERR